MRIGPEAASGALALGESVPAAPSVLVVIPSTSSRTTTMVMQNATITWCVRVAVGGPPAGRAGPPSIAALAGPVDPVGDRSRAPALMSGASWAHDARRPPRP